MRISVPPDSGNISVIRSDNSHDIHVNIRADHRSHHYQWFYFVLEGKSNESFTIHIDNAGGASYPGWNHFGVIYRAMASPDDLHWSRLETIYEDDTGVLSIQGQMISDRMTLAFFPPYTYARHLELIAKARTITNCNVTSLGQSVEGRDMTLLTFGSPGPDKKHIWMIARQHPGETMAEWYVEGLVEHLASDADMSYFFDQAVLHVVPNMNPDGTYHGNLRTNALGKDLNRQWNVMDNQMTAPEVYYVRQAILHDGVAALFDIHGDETHPYVFLNGQSIDCSVNPDTCILASMFLNAYQYENPYLQNQSCYPMPAPGFSDQNIAKNFFAERVQCMAFTVEMPDKELLIERKSDGTPKTRDWTSDDCKQFGAQWLNAIEKVLPRLSNKKLLIPSHTELSAHTLQTIYSLHSSSVEGPYHPILSVIVLVISLFRQFRFLLIV